MDLSVRSSEKELLDRDDISFEEIDQNMRELDVINTWLGGHAISCSGLKTLLNGYGQTKIRICEIGCGGGDNLRALWHWCRKHGIEAGVIGIDYNPHCIQIASDNWNGGPAQWILSDYRNMHFEEADRPDIVFSSLFCHHFSDDELVPMLHWMDRQSRRGWFINDLHRHILAYHSIRWLTRWFSRSRLVKNDAPLSVLRGLERQEWTRLLGRSGISGYSLRWKWAFRWLITRRHDEQTAAGHEAL